MSVKPWGTLVGVRPTKLVHYMWREGKSEKVIKRTLAERYQLSEQKIALLMEVFQHEQPILTTIHQNPQQAAIYISIPFCPTRCTYCSFVSYSMKDRASLRQNYLQALSLEIQSLGQRLQAQSIVPSVIYVGGGTPTCLTNTQFHRLLQEIKTHFVGSHTLEFTVEAGRPETITVDKLSMMKEAGVTRVCVNPQTMQPKTLRKVNRQHSPQQIIDCAKLVKEMKFILNMDIILGLPGETETDVLSTIRQLLPLQPENMTVHALALKRASSMNIEHQVLDLPSDDVVEQMSQICNTRLREQGYKPYYLYRQRHTVNNMENIGYTLPGYPCIYNIMMIDEQMTTIGCGAGAVSKFLNTDFTFDRMANPKDALMYNQRINEIIDKKTRWLQNA